MLKTKFNKYRLRRAALLTLVIVTYLAVVHPLLGELTLYKLLCVALSGVLLDYVLTVITKLKPLKKYFYMEDTV